MELAQTIKVDDNFLAECKRNELIREQARVLLRLVYQYKQNISLLKKCLNEYKEFVIHRLQPDAIELTLDFLERKKDQFLIELREEVRNILVSIRMETPESSVASNVLREEQAVFELDSNHQAQECELIASYIANYFINKNAPKSRVYRNKNHQVKVTLSLGNDFKNANDHPELTKNAKGFAEYFATAILIGDSNFMDNAAIRSDQQGNHYWARGNYANTLNYSNFANGLEHLNLDHHFQDLEFIYQLNKAVDYIDEKRIRLSIKTAFTTLKESYRTNFLQNKEIIEPIQTKMNLEGELNEQIIEDKIIENISNLRNYLKKLAENKFNEFIKEANFAAKGDSKINYKQLFNDSLKNNNKTPTDLGLFMKHAIRNNDYQGVEYLSELNKKLNYENIKIDNSTPLEFALKEEKNELALKMLKDGFALTDNDANKNEKDKKNIELALENILARKLKRT